MMKQKKLTEKEIMEQSMQINLESDLEHEWLIERYKGMRFDKICRMEDKRMREEAAKEKADREKAEMEEENKEEDGVK